MMYPKGFSLVEILVVVIILGILGAIVIPQFASASDAAKANTLATMLRVVRSQMGLFRLEHSIAPGYPEFDTGSAPTAEALVDQLTLATNEDGETASLGTAGYEYGRYLKTYPTNPVNDQATTTMLADGEGFPAAASGTTGWIYSADTMTFRANCLGADEEDVPLYEY